MKQCRYCPRRTLASNDAAWGGGWRWFTGTTQDGRPYDDAACPRCAGLDPVTSIKDSWDVVCWTCTWSFKADDFEEGDPLLDAADAVALGREHRCEPDIRLVDPDENSNYLYDFNRDGTLREKEEKRTP